MSDAKQLEDELARLREENERLKARKTPPLTFKVSEKGAVSVYGIGRFPVTLYYEQWRRLLEKTDELAQFLEANKPGLKLKED